MAAAYSQRPGATGRRYSRFVWGYRLLGGVMLLAGCGVPPVYVRTPGLGSDSGFMEDAGTIAADQGGGYADSGVAVGTGGVIASGGMPGTGGSSGTGGLPEVGGRSGTGGMATGGTSTGGVAATGGASAGDTGGSSSGTAGTGAGGVIATGGAGVGGTGTGGGTTSTGGAGTGGMASDTARYNFESSTQSWATASGTTPFNAIAQSTTFHYAGRGSLAGSIKEAASNLYYLSVVPSTAIPAGASITFHVFIPTGSTILWVQPFTQEGSPNFAWTGTAVPVADLTVGDWNTMMLKVPANSAAIAHMGVQFNVGAAWTGTVYVDSVTW